MRLEGRVIICIQSRHKSGRGRRMRKMIIPKNCPFNYNERIPSMLECENCGINCNFDEINAELE